MRFLEQIYPYIAEKWPMHTGQREMHASPARFRTLACGSRWGKTTASAAEIMVGMASKKGMYWCVGPTYELADKPFRKVLYGWLNFQSEVVDKYSESDRYIRLKNGSECRGKSADHPASLLGEGVSGMTIDEPPVMRESIWQEFLISRLNNTKAWALQFWDKKK